MLCAVLCLRAEVMRPCGAACGQKGHFALETEQSSGLRQKTAHSTLTCCCRLSSLYHPLLCLLLLDLLIPHLDHLLCTLILHSSPLSSVCLCPFLLLCSLSSMSSTRRYDDDDEGGVAAGAGDAGDYDQRDRRGEEEEEYGEDGSQRHSGDGDDYGDGETAGEGFPEWFPEDPVPLDVSTSSVIIVDHLPQVDMDRYEKLVGFLKSSRKFGAYGTIVQDGLYVPVANGKTLGYAFIEYDTVEEASKAVLEANGTGLDGKHIMAVNHFDDYDRLQGLAVEWTPPRRSDFENAVNLQSWLLDELGRDQFVVRHGIETAVYWNDPHRKANEFGRTYKYGGEREKQADKHWTDLYVAWSSKGSYLLTFHQQGVALWGGDGFEKLGRLAHTGVAFIDFSPTERFVVTSNGRDKVNKTDPECIIVWDVRTQKKLRGFEKGEASTAVAGGGGGGPSWPVFRWSHDDLYLARQSKDAISVYVTPEMGLLDKKSLKLPGVSDFAWSPTESVLAYWIPSAENAPATVAIIELPSRRVVREKHLYNVVDIKLHWQDRGDFLCIKVARKKSKKTMTTNFEVFRMREKDIPIEVVELDDSIAAFAWEPSGSRFAIIHGEGSRASVSVFSVQGRKVSRLQTFEQRQGNALFWSPAGNHLLVAGLGSMNGQLEWLDVDGGESLSVSEHFMCNEVEWDPSGRYVLTAVTQPIGDANWRFTMDNGYRLWSMQGQLLATVPLEQAYQVLWRPRPKNILTKEQVAEVARTLKERYWRRFEAEDDEIRRSQLQGRDKERAELKAQWKAYRQRKEEEYTEERDMRAELRGGYLSEDEKDLVPVEQLVEEEVAREEEIVS